MAKGKKTYRIAEVCKIAGVQPYVLRYWETEFPALSKASNRRGAARVYTDQEVALVRRIKSLLYEEGVTMPTARKRLEGGGASSPPAPVEAPAPSPAAPPAPPIAAPAAAPAGEQETSIDTDRESWLNGRRQGFEAVLEELDAVSRILA